MDLLSFSALAKAVSGIVSAAGSIASPIMNYLSTENANETNLTSTRETNAQNFWLANTYLQRRKEDALAAGYSPLAALEGAGNYSNIITAPQIQAADYSGMGLGLAQLFNSLVQDENNKAQQDETKRSNISKEDLERSRQVLEKYNIDMNAKNVMLQANNSLQIAMSKNATDKEIADARLELERVLADKTINNQILMQNKELAAQARNLERQLKSQRGNVWIQTGGSFLNSLVSAFGSIASSLLKFK